MTISSDTWASSPVRDTPANIMHRWLRAALHAYAAQRARRHHRAKLRALSLLNDATLKDIGVHRSEILSLELGDGSGRIHGSAEA